MSKKHITAKDFYDVFIQEWEILSASEDIDGVKPFEDRPAWTERMQKADGFLNKVMNRLASPERPLYYRIEWYKVDALYVGGEDIFGHNHSYPSAVEVIIEHEFGERLEEEMWKLIHWRSPLKVIIGYDWSGDEKTTPTRRDFAKDKIATLKRMLSSVNAFFPENVNTEYLFLIGGRHETKGPFFWWAASNNSFKVDGPDGPLP